MLVLRVSNLLLLAYLLMAGEATQVSVSILAMSLYFAGKRTKLSCNIHTQ